jgi:hypothetical protein
MSTVKEEPAMQINWEPSGRGFMYGEFKDRYGESCSIQESSLATEAAIWFGPNANTKPHMGMTAAPRMHLTQEQVAELLPILQHFVDTGRLPWPDDNAPDGEV